MLDGGVHASASDGNGGRFGVAMRAMFAAAIFLGAMLLFQVQPLVARFILPWFGGSAAVWTACVLFFQAFLLLGYAYAHLIATHLSLRAQVAVHVGLLALGVASLPIIPSPGMAPEPGGDPVWQIVVVLAVCVGLPYTLLSTVSPLLQRWFSQLWPDRSPYRLYALSNAGSLLGLLSYPFLLEGLLTRAAQGWLWGAAFIVQALLSAVCAVAVMRRAVPVTAPVAGEVRSSTVSWVDRALWVVLPAVASLLLLAFTNQICQDVASMPFLWVVPMVLYLLSFILSFSSGRWYRRPVYAVALLVAVDACWAVLLGGRHVALGVQVVTLCVGLFVACMFCHGELYHRRPGPKRLTSYYLSISVGGALGGLFVAVVAPLVFDAYYELHLGLVAVALLPFVVYALPTGNRADEMARWTRLGIPIAMLVLAAVMGAPTVIPDPEAVAVERNFHGVIRILDVDRGDPKWHRVVEVHGGTDHGFQYCDEERSRLAVAYYSPISGAGVVLQALPVGSGRRVGMVGLGAGVLAGYGEPGDVFRFYELNPAVIRFASSRFTYLERSAAQVEVLEGDGRLLLEREPAHSFDALILDAFSSDAIPVHLLTAEAFTSYRRLLRDDGVLAIHLTNRHMDLVPVALRLAALWGGGVEGLVLRSPRNDRIGAFPATYAVVTANAPVIDALLASGAERVDLGAVRGRPWTDDFSNPLEVLSWR